MKPINLTQGKTAWVDDVDYKKVSRHKWYWQKSRMENGYAATGNKPKMLHNFILNPPSGLEVDHIDGDGLNNGRTNLRIVTRAQQCQNRKQGSCNLFC